MNKTVASSNDPGNMKKERILYHMGHYGFMPKMLLHKRVYHKNSDAVFILDQSFSSKRTREFVSGWNEKNSDFGFLYGYSDWTFRHESDVSSLENEIELFFDDLFEKINVPIKYFDKIYSGFDGTNAFGAYISIKNKQYTLFDLGGTITKRDHLYDLSRHPEHESAYWKVLKKYKTLSADSETVFSIIWDSSHESVGKKDVVLNYIQMQNELTKQEKSELVSAFLGTNVESGDGYTLIALRSAAANQSKTKKSHLLLSNPQQLLHPYRLLMDCCCTDERILLKSHPNYDLSEVIDETIPNATSLPGYFPFEFLTLSEKLKITKIVNVGSSSTKYMNIDTEFLDVPYSQEYFNHYLEMNAINISLQLSKYLYDGPPNVYCAMEIWREKLNSLLASMAKGVSLINGEEADVLDHIKIINDDQIEMDFVKSLESQDGGSCTIVINPSIQSVKLFWKMGTIIEIKKVDCTGNAINYVGDLDPEYVMLVSNDRDIIDAAKKYTSNRDMPHCGIKLQCSAINTEDFITKKQDLSGSVVLRAARMGNREALAHVWKWLDDAYGGDAPRMSESFDHIMNAFSTVVSTLAHSGNGDAMGYMGRMYCDGKGVEKDLCKAAEWTRKAADKNVEWAKNQLLNILWRIGTPESYRQMVSIATELIESESGYAMRMLGLAYREGNGVEKDLNKAANFLRMANKKMGWIGNELFDTLWRIGTPESYREMISVTTKFAKLGNGGAMGRLGRAYRDGKGVEKDIDKAIEWMRKASDKNLNWAKNELFDMLWKRSKPEDFIEAKNLAESSAKNGDLGGMGRLGRVYRDGKGVEKDIDKAIEWMRKAVPRSDIWKKELIDILRKRKSVEDLAEIEKLLNGPK